MLKFSVGYQFCEDTPFSSIVKQYAHGIEEVYFPWTDMATGRSLLSGYDGYTDYHLQNQLIQELQQIKACGVELNLLFNANCYGDDAISRALLGKICAIIDFLSENGVMPESVTTASPAIAYMIKEHYAQIRTKASVNMKIASVKGMEYVAHLFDAYCVAKECNRDIPRLRDLKTWANSNGKKITILANSGCMRDCSGQIFHDNMVAHEHAISQKQNINFMPYMCWNHLKNKDNFVSILQNTWIRPEDIDRYEGLTDSVKLATRAHALPALVIGSYVRRKYFGNLPDLFEPGFGPAIAPHAIDSSKLPDDFWERTVNCDKKCETCDYCKQALSRALVFAG